MKLNDKVTLDDTPGVVEGVGVTYRRGVELPVLFVRCDGRLVRLIGNETYRVQA